MVFRGALFLNGIVDLEMGAQHGRKPYMNVRNVLSADEIASLVLTISGQRKINVSDSTGRFIVYGSVACFKG